MGNKIYVGIDLGTTNTLVAYEKNGKKITTLPFIGSGNVLPSVLYLDAETQTFEIGLDAYRNGNYAPESRIKSSKTFMGREKVYELPVNHGKPITMTPTDVAAEILKAVKERIIKKLKLNSDDEICAVITVPAAFSAIQKEETKKAAEMAGLTCLGLRPEPVAAAIAGAEGITANSMVFVVDIGGGTYDTAVVYLDENLNPEIVSQEGDRELGGDDFDNIIYNYLLRKVGDELGIDLTDERHANIPRDQYLFIVAEIRDGARKAKEELSNVEEYYVKFEKFIIDGYNNNEPVHLSYKITRDRFNALCKDIYSRIEERLDKSIIAFKNTGHSMDSITHLVLVGGSCYIPAVIELCERKIGKRASAQCDKTTAVAEGAGIMAKNWTTVGEGIGGLVAQSMGIKIAGEKFSKIVEKGTKYPCRKTEPYTTTFDNQTSVRIEIFFAAPDKEDIQNISEHEYYGFFTLENIQRAKKGVPQIDVTFDFDSSEQLTVTATDRATGSTNTLIVDRNASHREESSSSAPMAIDLLIDVSGSMAGQPLREAKKACEKMISEIVDFSSHKVGITAFESSSKEICEITSDRSLLLRKVATMSADGGTNMAPGIEKSYKKLIRSEMPEKIIFLMTDGEPFDENQAQRLANKIRTDSNVRLAVIFIGSTSDGGYSIAKRVAAANAKNGEKPLFYTSVSMSELGDIFQRVYTDITTRY